MNEALVRNFNEVVSREDTCWHLGDFSLDERVVERYLRRLNGTHHLVCGNHDRVHPKHKQPSKKYLSYGFASVQTEIVLPGNVLMTHMPPTDYEDPRYPEYRPDPSKWSRILHGHVHQRWLSKMCGGTPCVNVGVDVHGMRPILLETALNLEVTS